MQEKLYPVSPEWARRAHIDGPKYEAMYAASVQDPEGFWYEEGGRIDWFRPFTKVKNTTFGPGDVSIRWFVRPGACTNVDHRARAPERIHNQRGNPRRDLVSRGFERRCGLAQPRIALVQPLARGFAGQCFDAPDSRRHRTFADDLQQLDVAQRADVRAAAQLD